MAYQSPIEVIQTQLQSSIEGEIYNAVMRVGVNVDKDELLKALRYDRNQYQKGYADRDSEIVRCKECKHGRTEMNDGIYYCTFPGHGCTCHVGGWFCADGERKNNG